MTATPAQESGSVADRLIAGGKVATAMAAYEIGKQVYVRGLGYWRENLRYTVTVADDDYLYADVHDWVLAILPESNVRSVKATTGRSDDMSPVPDGRPAGTDLRLTYDDQRAKAVEVDGHRVMVRVVHADVTKDIRRTPDHIEFSCHTKTAHAAIIEHLRSIRATKGARKPSLQVVGQWGDWQRRPDMPTRTLDSVILPPEQKAAIVEDLRGFLDAEQQYNRLGIPWHRGLMFHGPPGTGKTTMAKALAAEFGLDLWYIPLSDLRQEASLTGLLAGVGPRSILLLEDIDTVAITHDREDAPAQTKPGISLSSLLNCLDGVLTPHGLITVMTTNNLDALDPALRRAGRMDRIEELALPGPGEIAEMYQRFYGEPLPFEPCAGGVSHAEVSEVFKRHLDDHRTAASALHRTLGASVWQSVARQ